VVPINPQVLRIYGGLGAMRYVLESLVDLGFQASR
jgi:hypothetical protein